MNIKTTILCLVSSFFCQSVISSNSVQIHQENVYPSILDAVMRYDVDILRQLIESGSNVNLKDKDGLTPLMMAVMGSFGVEEKVRLLIEAKADVLCQDVSGNTALIWAVVNKNKGAVRMLIEAGSNVNQAEERGITPLIWAAIQGDTDMLQLLMDSGAAVNSEDRIMHMTALMHVAYVGRLGAVRLLIEKGADITHQDKEGSTALIHALNQGNLSIAQLLGWRGGRG